jgi:hypothetical protein
LLALIGDNQELLHEFLSISRPAPAPSQSSFTPPAPRSEHFARSDGAQAQNPQHAP